MATTTNAGEVLTLTTIREGQRESFGGKKKQYVPYNNNNNARDTNTGRVVARGPAGAGKGNSSNDNMASSKALYVDATGMVGMAMAQKIPSFNSDESSRTTQEDDDSYRLLDDSNSSDQDHCDGDGNDLLRTTTSLGVGAAAIHDSIAVEKASPLPAAVLASERTTTVNKPGDDASSLPSQATPILSHGSDSSKPTNINITPAAVIAIEDAPTTSPQSVPHQKSDDVSALSESTHINPLNEPRRSFTIQTIPNPPALEDDEPTNSPRSASLKKPDDVSALSGTTPPITPVPEQPRCSFTIKNINIQRTTNPRNVSNKSNLSLSNKSNHSLGNKSNRSLSNKSNHSLGNKSNRSLSNKSNHSLGNKSNRSLSNKSNHSLGKRSNHSLANKSNRSLSNKKGADDASDLSEATPINFSEPKRDRSTVLQFPDEGSVLSETTPINFREPSKRSIPLKNDDSLSETTPINFHEPTLPHDDDSLSETTPINFHEPSGEFTVQSKRTSDGGSDLSETTPVKFHESSGHLTISDGNSISEPFRLTHRAASQTRLGIDRKNSSKVFTDDELDADAERDIVNVYMDVVAFAGRERLNLTEDIYSFVLACSSRSYAFYFAIYFIFVKYICYGVLLMNLMKQSYEGEENNWLVVITKFWMIPVSVSMQEDLITVYYNAANKRYDALTYKRNMSATYPKWVLCNLLRAIDGLLGLLVNFYVMLLNTQVLDIFLSFAALHFLQFIDDVIYELAEKGFFGHKMEQATIACKVITFTRRTQTADKCNNMITDLDSILLGTSILLCYLTYVIYIAIHYSDEENREDFGSGFNAFP